MSRTYEAPQPAPDNQPNSSSGNKSNGQPQEMWDPRNGIAQKPESLDEIGLPLADETPLIPLDYSTYRRTGFDKLLGPELAEGFDLTLDAPPYDDLSVPYPSEREIEVGISQPNESDVERRERLQKEAWGSLFKAFLLHNASKPSQERPHAWLDNVTKEIQTMTESGITTLRVEVDSMAHIKSHEELPALLQCRVYDTSGGRVTAAISSIVWRTTEQSTDKTHDEESSEVFPTFPFPNYILSPQKGYTHEKLWEIMQLTAHKIEEDVIPPDEFAV